MDSMHSSSIILQLSFFSMRDTSRCSDRPLLFPTKTQKPNAANNLHSTNSMEATRPYLAPTN
jgi:hypothetical protein